MVNSFQDIERILKMAESRLSDDCDYVINNLSDIVKSIDDDLFGDDSELDDVLCVNKLLSAVMKNPIASKKLRVSQPFLFQLCEKTQFYDTHNGKYDEFFLMDIIKKDLVSSVEALFRNFSKNRDVNTDTAKRDVENVDFEFVGCGCISCAFKVGEYIVKLGRVKDRFEIPAFDDDLAQPLMREVIKDKEGNSFFTIEVQRRLDLIKDKQLGEKLVRYFKEKFLASGWIWRDGGMEDIGILSEDDNNERVIPVGFGGFIEIDKTAQQPIADKPSVRARIFDLDGFYKVSELEESRRKTIKHLNHP